MIEFEGWSKGKDTEITEKLGGDWRRTTLHVLPGSNAEKYAIEHGIRYVIIRTTGGLICFEVAFMDSTDEIRQPKPANIKKWYNTPTPKYQEPEGDSRL